MTVSPEHDKRRGTSNEGRMSFKMRGTSREENVIWDETHGCGV